MLSEQINLERISIQLILALHYLHSDSTRPKSIVHRDLKPENGKEPGLQASIVRAAYQKSSCVFSLL